MAKMTDKEITQFMEFYIGINDYGELRGFRDTSHLREFYYVDCDLDIEPSWDNGTTDEFERILRSQSPQYQARILRAGLEEFFVPSQYETATTQEKLRPRLESVVARLEFESTVIENVAPQNSSESVRLALEEAENLIRRGRIPSAVDRVHTALHAHIKHLCDERNIQYHDSPKIRSLFKTLRDCHPALKVDNSRAHDVGNILDKLSAMLDALSPIRNKASLSHPPEEELLEEAEATLAINATWSIFNYLEHKIQNFRDLEIQSAHLASVDDIPF